MPVRYVPRHGRPPGHRAPAHRQATLAGALAVAVSGGTVALAATGPEPGAAVVPAALARTPVERAAGTDDGVDAAQEQRVQRASRARAVPAPPPPAPPPSAPPSAPPPPPPPVLPGCEGQPVTGYANGRIPASALCELPGTAHRLRADAARAFVRLRAAYETETGAELCLTDSYRSLEAQRRAKRAKPRLTAAPGLSNHGDGTAVDFCGGVESFRTAAHAWMRANAGRFGWVHPSWAGPRGKRPEPWHWEYRG